ncbi:MAG: hypothetical protein Q9226_005155 [Calogaya cf. arnoldii]
MVPEDDQLANDHKKDRNAYDLRPIVGKEDTERLCPIRYVYDYLAFQPNWLKPQPLSLRPFWAESQERCRPIYSINSIPLNTLAANLPVHTGLDNFRQNKHWRASERSTKELLQLFASDERCKRILLSNKKSMASLAEEQLKGKIMDTYCRFSIYAWPEVDENRARLLAQGVVLLFMFDDVWENASEEMIENTRQFFIARLRNTLPNIAEATPLEARLDAIRRGFLAGDEEGGGNGGAEILETLINFYHRVEPPREGFSSIRQYLDYRWTDVGNRYVFSIYRNEEEEEEKERNSKSPRNHSRPSLYLFFHTHSSPTSSSHKETIH